MTGVQTCALPILLQDPQDHSGRGGVPVDERGWLPASRQTLDATDSAALMSSVDDWQSQVSDLHGRRGDRLWAQGPRNWPEELHPRRRWRLYIGDFPYWSTWLNTEVDEARSRSRTRDSKQAESILLRCMSLKVCRFSDAGNDETLARSGSRRSKSAKARNRGR